MINGVLLFLTLSPPPAASRCLAKRKQRAPRFGSQPTLPTLVFVINNARHREEILFRSARQLEVRPRAFTSRAVVCPLPLSAFTFQPLSLQPRMCLVFQQARLPSRFFEFVIFSIAAHKEGRIYIERRGDFLSLENNANPTERSRS